VRQAAAPLAAVVAAEAEAAERVVEVQRPVSSEWSRL
jgi:hypothetical protein